MLARRRVPRMFFDFVESGSWRESTLARNVAAFERIELRQRVAVDVERRSLASHLLARTSPCPWRSHRSGWRAWCMRMADLGRAGG